MKNTTAKLNITTIKVDNHLAIHKAESFFADWKMVVVDDTSNIPVEIMNKQYKNVLTTDET